MRILLLIIVRNAERHLPSLFEQLKLKPLGQQSEILVIDDASNDKTLFKFKDFFGLHKELNGHILNNTYSQGFGANQKVGYRYAIDRNFDAVAVFYPQDRYSLEHASSLLEVLQDRQVGCVIGNTLVDQGLHQAAARIFHSMLNWISGLKIQNWSSSFRLYSVAALKNILFEFNSHKRQFDVEILLQLLDNKVQIHEKNIPSSQQRFYFSHNLKSVFDSLKVTLRYRFQRYHLFYDIRFHPELLIPEAKKDQDATVYREKFSMESPHTAVTNNPALIPQGASVLDVGCATGYVAMALRENKKCHVTGVDMLEAALVLPRVNSYIQANLETQAEEIKKLIQKNSYDVIMMLDVLEHLSFPEIFLLKTFRVPQKNNPTYIFSTANVAFFLVRILLFFGIFNYGTKGILDVTHKRLFTVRTFENLMEQTGFIVIRKQYFPFPFAMLGLPEWICEGLKKINKFLIRLSPSLFAYQMLFQTVPLALPQKVASEIQ